MRNLLVVGDLWLHVVVRGGSVVDDLSGFCTLKSLEDFCGLIFLRNLVQSFRNPKWETAGIVGLVAILVFMKPRQHSSLP